MKSAHLLFLLPLFFFVVVRGIHMQLTKNPEILKALQGH